MMKYLWFQSTKEEFKQRIYKEGFSYFESFNPPKRNLNLSPGYDEPIPPDWCFVLKPVLDQKGLRLFIFK